MPVVSAIKENRMYSGIDNPIRVAVPKFSCSDLIVHTDNGTLTGDGCEYVARPNGGSVLTVFVSVFQGKDTVTAGKWSYRVFSVPNPIPTVAGRDAENPEMSINRILASPMLVLKMVNFDHEIFWRVNAFDMEVTHADGNQVTFHTDGQKFTSEMIEKIKGLKPGASVKISSISASVLANDGSTDETMTRTLDDLELKIK
jgi:hypothetical protein